MNGQADPFAAVADRYIVLEGDHYITRLDAIEKLCMLILFGSQLLWDWKKWHKLIFAQLLLPLPYRDSSRIPQCQLLRRSPDEIREGKSFWDKASIWWKCAEEIDRAQEMFTFSETFFFLSMFYFKWEIIRRKSHESLSWMYKALNWRGTRYQWRHVWYACRSDVRPY